MQTRKEAIACHRRRGWPLGPRRLHPAARRMGHANPKCRSRSSHPRAHPGWTTSAASPGSWAASTDEAKRSNFPLLQGGSRTPSPSTLRTTAPRYSPPALTAEAIALVRNQRRTRWADQATPRQQGPGKMLRHRVPKTHRPSTRGGLRPSHRPSSNRTIGSSTHSLIQPRPRRSCIPKAASWRATSASSSSGPIRSAPPLAL